MTDGQIEEISGQVTRNGKEYRWLHDVSLWRDSMLPGMLLKIILLAALMPALLLLAIETIDVSLMQGLKVSAQVYAIVAGVLLGLFIIAYPLYALISGGRYSILFEMNDSGIDHIQMPTRGVKRTDLIARAGFVLGLASGNPAAAGANLLALSRKRMSTAFSTVRKLVIYERKHVIKLISRDMTRNLIYADPESFPLIRDLLLERCPKATRVIRR